MKKLALLLICLGLGFGSIAQTETDFETESFNAIHIGNSFEVYLQQAEEYSVTAEAPKELMDDIQIVVKDGVLDVRMKDGHKKNKWWNLKNDEIIVHITFPIISSLKLSGAVELDAKNVLDLEDLAIDASGATDIHLHVKCDDLAINLSGASELSMDAYADNFALEASGATDVVLTGETDDFSIECSGASEIDADQLQADDVMIDCSGASSITAWVNDEISITASGASDIRYKCEGCDDVQVKTSGSSSVKKY